VKNRVKNWRTGEMEYETTGARSITYDAFHEVGRFDWRKGDPDFIAGRRAIPQRRSVIQITVYAHTIELLDRLSIAMGMSRGRIVDKLVERVEGELAAFEKEKGSGTSAKGDGDGKG